VSAIEAKGIQKKFGKIEALKGIDLKIEEGEFFGLFGPNGAGKTTLLKILTAQLLPSAGEAKVLGIDVLSNPMLVKKMVGIVPEVESPPSYLTAYEYLYFVSKVRGVNDQEKKIREWMDFFDLRDSEKVVCKDLSKGMRQKLILASAFLHEPKVLFLDEPLTSLDPVYQRKVKDYLKEYVKRGGTIFMCSHLLEIAEKLCTNVGIINDGEIISSGKMEEVIQGGNLENIFLRLVVRED